jgi:6-phosphogluconate dehydrogenase
MTKPPADVGMIGLGVMGRNLALNMLDHRYRVAVYNHRPTSTRAFVASHPELAERISGCFELRELVDALATPRRIVMLIPAGHPVDAMTDQLMPLLDPGDVVVDGGNSKWTDTIRREKKLAERGLHFVGSGVSGGEEGARFGPSLMPGGSREAWRAIRPIWRAIAARVDRKSGKPIEGAAAGRPVKGGEPCVAHIGGDGAGHYVKMVHNGIEYADMQLISEAYFLLRRLGRLKPLDLADIFAEWNEGDLDSFLIEITSDILRQQDPENPRRSFVDAVLDAAGQKGTGKWTSMNALDMGVAAPTIAEAVFARIVSAFKEQRLVAAKKLRGPKSATRIARKTLVKAVHDALYASKVCAYAQGFALMFEAQREYGWKLDLGEIARIWRGGCIIRARFLQKIADAYGRDRRLANLLLDPYFRKKIHDAQSGWRKVVALAAQTGIASPAFMNALAYYDGYREDRSPACLLQAQRDYFGSHGYERVDRPRGLLFHLDWSDPERPEYEL